MSYVNTKEAKEILRVTSTTLRRWDQSGKIKTIRTPSGIRMYDRASIAEITHEDWRDKQRANISYCRVSTKKQIDDLSRQEDFYKRNYPNYELVSDIGSGINFKRKGLQGILERIMRGEVQELMVSHRDRLCRFAFELIEWICVKNNTKLMVLNKTEHQSSTEDLAEDVMSIIHVFSCREMGKRRYTNEKTNLETNSESETDI